MHISDRNVRDWIRNRLTAIERPTNEQLLKTADRMCRDYMFVNFVKNAFPTAKRFGCEGVDSFVSGLGALVDYAAEQGMQNIVLGMSHRGRLNVLYSILRKPAKDIISEFMDVGI